MPTDPFVNRGVQIVINPYPTGDGSRTCHLTTRTQGAARVASTGPNFGSLVGFLTPGLMAGIRTDRSTADDVVNFITNTQQADADKRGWAHRISGGSDPGSVKGLTVEVMFDATNTTYLDFVDAALEIIRSAYYDEPGSLAYLGWISSGSRDGRRRTSRRCPGPTVRARSSSRRPGACLIFRESGGRIPRSCWPGSKPGQKN